MPNNRDYEQVFVANPIDLKKYNFGDHLRNLVGPSPSGMFDPHAHHILFKTGLGETQKALVAKGQALLRSYGLDPIFGKENLVWAPNGVKGQHAVGNLRTVVEALEEVHESLGTKAAIVKTLEKQGQIAAQRKK